MHLICVAPDKVEEIWPHVRSIVKRAIDRGHTDWDFLERNLFSGAWLLWLAWDGKEIKGAVVTALVKDACELVACAGNDFRGWIHLIAGIEDYARNEGKKTMRLIGRRGWSRVLGDYKPTLVMLEKKL